MAKVIAICDKTYNGKFYYATQKINTVILSTEDR